MKLPDSEQLSTDAYWIISDQWKQEWERGVQVPVNPDSLPGSSVHEIPVVCLQSSTKSPRRSPSTIYHSQHNEFKLYGFLYLIFSNYSNLVNILGQNINIFALLRMNILKPKNINCHFYL